MISKYAYIRLLNIFKGLVAFSFIFLMNESFSMQNSSNDFLEKLVERNILSDFEAQEIKKMSVEIEPVNVCQEYNYNLRIGGKLQSQYELLSGECIDGSAKDSTSLTNTFVLRRIMLTFNTNYEKDWGCQLYIDFIIPHNVSVSYIWKKFDYSFIKGQMRVGYLKPSFCYEENLSPFDLYCVERSITTFYWCAPENGSRLAFGSFKTGAYWYGQSVNIEGLKYGCGVSNPENYVLFSNDMNRARNPDLWANVSYLLKMEESTITFALNSGFGSDANRISYWQSSSVIGLNPYISAEFMNTRLFGEFLISQVQDGKTLSNTYRQQHPMGINFAIEHKIDAGDFGYIAPVFRFSYLDTDSRGLNPSDSIRHFSNVKGDSKYARAYGVYGGVNWYINSSLRILSGYEFCEFAGGKEVDHKLNANSFRSQLQISF